MIPVSFGDHAMMSSKTSTGGIHLPFEYTYEPYLTGNQSEWSLM